MRVNEPITNNEIEFPESELLVSRTDPAGKIVFCNSAFVKISGYTEDELIGKPHNIVRHPHMPSEAFADLWQTVKSGRPWEGVVKNRAKNGDYYWVLANVTPVVEHGEVTGYISIRFKPTLEQRQLHEALYANIRAGKAVDVQIQGGKAVPLGWRYKARRLLDSLVFRHIAAMVLTSAFLVALAALGVTGASPEILAVTLGGAVLASAVVGRRLYVEAKAPLKRFEKHLNAILHSNFTHNITMENAGEFDQMIIVLRSLKAKLAYADQEAVENQRKRLERQRIQTEMAEHIEGDAHAVHAAAQEIAGAVGSQAATASQMSSSVAEITSTMEELSSSSTQVAEHSRSVVVMAEKTWENSKEGAGAMQGMLTRMEEIRTDNRHSLQVIEELGRKSKEISKIMQIIESVADQTKLIAFNAALEASSAGEAGKRFSVVAAEIRRLADNVTDSAGEIADKVGEIQDAISNLVVTAEKGAERIGSGMNESTRVAHILVSLENAAHESSTAAQQISLATQQQRTASGQVVIALREIVGASSQTADSIAKISHVARNMMNLSNQLETLVGRYQLRSPNSTDA